MEIRFDHVIVVIVAFVVSILAMFFLDSIFATSYKAKANQYNSEFETIKLEFEKRNYERVIGLAERIVDQDDPGSNDIRAKTYIGLAKLELNQTADAIGILEYLIHQYPGIEMVYGSWFNASKSKDSLTTIFKHILTEYIPGVDSTITSEMTLVSIYDAMDAKRWVGLISILIGSVAVYERIRKKAK